MTRRGRLLIVDDNPAVIRQAAQLLTDEFEIIEALADGTRLQEAVRAAPSGCRRARRDAAGAEWARAGVRPCAVWLGAANRVPHGPRRRRLRARGIPAGASAYVVKMRMGQDLVPALKAAVDGRTFVSRGADGGSD